MGFLSKFVKKIAPKVLKAVVIGGDKNDREALKSQVSNPVFDPIYQKFADNVETNVKIGAAIALSAVAGPALLGAAAGGGGAAAGGTTLSLVGGGGTTLATILKKGGAVLNTVSPNTTKSSDMSLLGSFAKGVWNDVKPGVSQLATSAMGKLFNGLVSAPSTSTATPPFVPPLPTSTTSTGTGTTTSTNFYENNKKWINPVGIGVGLLVVLAAIVKMVFGRRR